MEARKLAPGALITEPGVYDLTMDQYHGQPCEAPSVSSSGLRTIWSASPAHYWIESSLNPHRIDQGERPHFSLGRAAHHLLFLGRKGFDASSWSGRTSGRTGALTTPRTGARRCSPPA
jgi:hypothetical protein